MKKATETIHADLANVQTISCENFALKHHKYKVSAKSFGFILRGLTWLTMPFILVFFSLKTHNILCAEVSCRYYILYAVKLK